MSFFDKKDAVKRFGKKRQTTSTAAGAAAAAIAAGAALLAGEAGAQTAPDGFENVQSQVVSFVENANGSLTVTTTSGGIFTVPAGEFAIVAGEVYLQGGAAALSSGIAAASAGLASMAGLVAFNMMTTEEAAASEAGPLDPVRNVILTTGDDRIMAGNNDDVFSGVVDVLVSSIDTVQATDSLDGGEGFDELTVEITDIDGEESTAYVYSPVLTSIESLVLDGSGAPSSGAQLVFNADSDDALTDITFVGVYNNEDLILDTTNGPTSGLDLTLEGADDVNVGDTVSIELTLNETFSTLNGDSLTSLEIESIGDDNDLDLGGSLQSLETITITGTEYLDLDANDASALTSVDASAFSGILYFVSNEYAHLIESIEAGSGDDSIYLGGDQTTALYDGLTIDLGAGDDLVFFETSALMGVTGINDTTITLGDGMDTVVVDPDYTFVAAGEVVTITDFTLGENGDLLDVGIMDSNDVHDVIGIGVQVSTTTANMSIITYDNVVDGLTDAMDAAEVASVLAGHSIVDDGGSGTTSVLVVGDGTNVAAYNYAADGNGVIDASELTLFGELTDAGDIRDYHIDNFVFDFVIPFGG